MTIFRLSNEISIESGPTGMKDNLSMAARKNKTSSLPQHLLARGDTAIRL